ncbi:hypothetical protein ABZ890_37970, partial [Streptomyces sp. NPDC046984]
MRHHCGRHAVEHSLDRRSRLPLTAGGPLCLRPAAGRVTFDGTPLDYSSRALKAYRKRVQLVLQDP